jgi:hypothetical protein
MTMHLFFALPGAKSLRFIPQRMDDTKPGTMPDMVSPHIPNGRRGVNAEKRLF